MQLQTNPEWADKNASAVQQFFNISPNESQVALCTANGRTLLEASVELSMSFNTARAHLRSILAEMHLDKQSQVIRARLLGLPQLCS
jgi:DNA-binding CsgD family transcriptional regulator